VVVLASNLRENMDEAFVRRLRFIVDFPFPDEVHRAQIWRTHFPATAPLGADLDWQRLGKLLPVAGGNIKNIVLNAAFLAAAESGVIGMQHVLQSARREFEKIGKRWDDTQMTKRVSAVA
jgi:SpoVK/Ycf46/Vps4 family AAA+-type ATPase